MSVYSIVKSEPKCKFYITRDEVDHVVSIYKKNKTTLTEEE